MVEKTVTNGTETQEAPKTTATTSKTTTRSTRAKDDSESMALSFKEEAEIIPLPGNRPIESSHLNIVSTYHAVGGDRPVVASGLDIKEMISVSGNRPIVASHLQISETYKVMGNRPVASNAIDDPQTLMGFLD